MKTIQNFLLAAVLIAGISIPASAQQNTVLATTLSAAMTASQQTISLASYTGVNYPTATTPASALYIVDPGSPVGELVKVSKYVNSTYYVQRASGNNAKAHVSGAMVLVATLPSWFQTVNPQGACTTASTYVTPWVNTTTGEQWLCSSKTLSWVPGWGNLNSTPQVITATATASVAGATAIAAPLLHISGTNAITSFTMGTGWQNNNFCVIPDAAFTTTATNNIAKASTAVANVTLCFTYDSNVAKFVPSY